MISQQASQVTLTSSHTTKGSSGSKERVEGEFGAFGPSGAQIEVVIGCWLKQHPWPIPHHLCKEVIKPPALASGVWREISAQLEVLWTNPLAIVSLKKQES